MSLNEMIALLQNSCSTVLPAVVLEPWSDSKRDHFACQYKPGKLVIKASNARSAIYALSRMHAAQASGFWSECIGDHMPAFALRPLWLNCRKLSKVSANVATPLPEALFQNDHSPLHFAKRILELGYNSLILICANQAEAEWAHLPLEKVQNYFREIQDCGIQLYLQPHFVSGSNVKDFISHFPDVGLFWTSSDFSTNSKATLLDLVVADVKRLEAVCKRPIIYYLPCAHLAQAKLQTQWLTYLCDEVSARTKIAFSAVAGEPCDQFLPLHPLFDVLRMLPDPPAIPFLPIVNIGAVQHGEGLWPAFTFDQAHLISTRCRSLGFGGVIAMTESVPMNKGFLDCCLWVGGHTQWLHQEPDLLAEMWFKAYRPELDYASLKPVLGMGRTIAIQLRRLRVQAAISPEEGKALCEALLAKVQWMQCALGKYTGFKEYGYFFAKDARRMLVHYMQAHKLPFTAQAAQDDLSESFWTQVIAGVGKSMKSITLLDRPFKGVEGSPLAKIYLENS